MYRLAENLNKVKCLKKEVENRYAKRNFNTAIIMKNIIEIISRQEPVWRDFIGGGGRIMTDEKVTCDKNRKYAIWKMRRILYWLLNKNFDYGSKFITLTFEENMKDLKVANYEFKKFIERLKYEEEKRIAAGRKYDFKEFKYLAVIEFQKRGAIHYHMISNIEYMRNKDLRKIWSNGFVRINKISDCDNVGLYVIKYMNKDLNDVRLHKRKAYLRSNNLEWPEVINDDIVVRDLVEKKELIDDDEVDCNVFKSEHYGKITKRVFNLKQTKRGKKRREEIFIEECKKVCP